MKYAIYDKAADGYLTKMEFEVGYSEHTQFECGYNEYITEAQLLDTPKEAADAIIRIESFKFMEKGRFVAHSFDDTLKDQYIISEAGNPTKVVDNITVDLEGTINVKYGTMAFHWSTAFLEYAINRMNALQKAIRPVYTSWCNTFDIYKVITVMDEKEHTHYQFINVTTKSLEKYAKDEVLVIEKEPTDIIEPLNKRIEELEKANYELGQTATARGVLANRLQKENDDLKTKVEAIKKEAHHWKTMYEKLFSIRNSLAEVIYAMRNAICNNDSDAFRCIENRMKFDPDFNSDPFMAGVRENIKDICIAIKRNIANHELKNSEITRLANEKKQALERSEFYKRQANSVYGMIVPTRRCGKQAFCDAVNGKKILIDKKKYDDLIECVNNISLTYEMMKLTPFSMDRPSWLSGIINRINNLTK